MKRQNIRSVWTEEETGTFLSNTDTWDKQKNRDKKTHKC